MKKSAKPFVIYLDPKGVEANGIGAPFGIGRDAQVTTLARAQALVRKARKLYPSRPIRVMLRGGRYELSETLVFGPQDGGTEAASVVWSAAPGEKPVISGGRKVNNWTKDKINGIDCLSAQFPKRFNPLQLFVDGHRAQRPRLPKQGFYRFKSSFGKRYLNETLWGEGPDEAEYETGDLRAFQNLQDVRLIVMGAWYEMWMRIIRIDESRCAVKFHRDCWQRLVDETGRSSRYFVENIVEALTEPGEWYFNRATGKIHYIPRPGQEAEAITAFAPVLDRLIHVRGTRQHPVAHLRFENLTFEHCDWHPPDEFRGSIQAGHRAPGALLFENAETCVLYGCEVARVGQYAVQLGQGSHDCRIVACTLRDLGAGGVHVDHEWLKPHSGEVEDAAALRKPDRRPRRATVSDCTIREGGRIYPGAVGIFVGNAGFNRILHNHVHDLFYSGISVGWTWGMAPTACVDNRIENNHVHHCNWDRTFSDLGLIYTLGAQPGSTILGNHLHHVSSYGYGGEGIYNDEGSSGFVIENNVIHRCRHAGYSGAPRDVVVRNNIFAFCEQTQANPAVQGMEWFGTVFERNIIIWNEGSFGNAAPFGFTPRGTLARHNLLWADGIPLRLTDGHDLAYWQANGQLMDTLVADPLFLDPEGGDFRLRAGSPAVAHGFQPIKIVSGPRGGPVRPEGYDEWLRSIPDLADRPILFARIEQVDADHLLIRVRNPGCVAASGSFEWELPKGIELSGPERLRISLKAGNEQTVEVKVSGAIGMHRVALWPSNKWWTPAFCLVETGAGQFQISRAQPVKKVEDVPKALQSVPQSALHVDGHDAGFVRVAWSGANLLVSARLFDAQVRSVEKAFWEGSCFELFLAPQFRASPVQIVLVPDANKRRFLAHRQHMFTPVPLPELESSFQATSDGYLCHAIVPLALFGINKPEATIGRLEITAGVHPAEDSASSVKATLFGAEQPSRVTRGMASVSFL